MDLIVLWCFFVTSFVYSSEMILQKQIYLLIYKGVFQELCFVSICL